MIPVFENTPIKFQALGAARTESLPSRHEASEEATPRMVAPAWAVRIARILHRCYKYTLSPLIGNQCRFYPSCSDYALEAVERHGVIRGAALAAKRLARCSPLHEGGIDLVPAPRQGNHHFR